jgi:molybdenum cofactor cytidylyltransferase
MKRKNLTAGVILASGLSTRFGRPKQLLELCGRPMLQWVVDAALGSCLDVVVLVLGSAYADVVQAIDAHSRSDPRLRILVNPDYRRGMSTSLRAGVSAVQGMCRTIMFLLGDQPLVNSAMIDRMLSEHQRSGHSITVPVHCGTRGHPVVFPKDCFRDLLQITGDTGARAFISARWPDVHQVEIQSPQLFLDIDTPKDAETVGKLLEHTRKEPLV